MVKPSGKPGKGGGGGQGRPTKKAPVRPQKKGAFYAVLVGIAAVAGLLIVWQASRTGSSEAVIIDPNTPLPEAQGYLMGNPDAPVQVLEFADFECPACGTYANLTKPDVVKRLVETGQISFKFLDFPLPDHPNTWAASMAAACANEQGKFWEMHDQIFATQDRWSGYATSRPKGVFSGLAKDLGLNMAQWESCFDSQKYKLNIAANQKEGERRLISQTPTFIIGSRMIPGAIGFDGFRAYVDTALAEKGVAPAARNP